MNNNFYNPYGNYYQSQVNQIQPTIPMVYVNGLEGAKSYWMGVNQTVYLRDNNDESILYEKKTDAVGRYQIKGYKLVELQIENNMFKTNTQQDDLKVLNDKLDAIISLINPKQEVKPNE